MTRNVPTELEGLALELPCDYCNARGGTWCITASGRWPGKHWATWLHANREWVVREAWRVGYSEHASMMRRFSPEELLDWHDQSHPSEQRRASA